MVSITIEVVKKLQKLRTHSTLLNLGLVDSTGLQFGFNLRPEAEEELAEVCLEVGLLQGASLGSLAGLLASAGFENTISHFWVHPQENWDWIFLANACIRTLKDRGLVIGDESKVTLPHNQIVQSHLLDKLTDAGLVETFDEFREILKKGGFEPSKPKNEGESYIRP